MPENDQNSKEISPKSEKWLLLTYHFSEKAGSLRVKIWRRLRAIGAVAIKNSLYALPSGEDAMEDLQWILAELTAAGVEGAIIESRFVQGISDDQVREMFREARNQDYQAIIDEIAAFEPANSTDQSSNRPDPAGQKFLNRLRKRMADIKTIDFCSAPNRQPAEQALDQLAERVGPNARVTPTDAAIMANYAGRTWVTRRFVRVDRIASAWLIRRWIDANATFKFVDGRTHPPSTNEVRFDMFEGEFTHEGNACTFEVLARLVAPDDKALAALAEIIHDIDLKDDHFGRPEAAGVSLMLDAITIADHADEERLKLGAHLFENLYQSLSRKLAEPT